MLNLSASAGSNDDPAAEARRFGSAAIATLAGALIGPDALAAVRAAEVLLALGYGRPTQPLAFSADGVHVEIAGGEADATHHGNGKAAGHLPDEQAA